MRLFVLATLILANIAIAETGDGDVHHFLSTSNACTKFFDDFEKSYDLPSKLLASVSITETGRFNQNIGEVRSWPWSVNHLGQPFYFNSKSEAIAFVASLIRKGHRSIDVGCMQVNLKYHPTAFSNLHQAFDPGSNIAYAAGLLKKHYLNHTSWVRAIAKYHSGETSRGKEYANRVLNVWKKQKSMHTNTTQQAITHQAKTIQTKDKLIENFPIKKEKSSIPIKNPLRLRNEMIIYSSDKNQ